MAAINPRYAKQPGGGVGLHEHTLNDAEYAFFLTLLATPPFQAEPVMDTSGNVVTKIDGDVVMAKVVY